MTVRMRTICTTSSGTRLAPSLPKSGSTVMKGSRTTIVVCSQERLIGRKLVR